MKLAVEMRFGSHLYGTATPASDLDLKAVYLPDAQDILLQRVRPVFAFSRPKAPGERNRPNDVDREIYSLQRYLDLLAEGHTVALDMLFAPDAMLTRPPHCAWREIQANADRLVSRRTGAFVRYCRQQADRYGLKGSRIAAVRAVLAVLAEAEGRLGTTAKLERIAGELAPLVDGVHVGLVEIDGPAGSIRHLAVSGRRLPLTGSIKNARAVVQRLFDAYGERTLAAERNEGVDWKALSHAVRVAQEALELFATGRIVFPLAGAAHLGRIKAGELPYAAVAEEIEMLVEKVERAAAQSHLPEEPDRTVIDAIVARAYRKRVVDAG